jgi:MerR family mercuric resistance operon transcriptional regulator
MDRNLTIGRVAHAAGVNVETVRYYQRRGLVAEPERPLNGVRRYAEDSVMRIRFIRRAQELGFTLAEIANLLALEDGRSCRETRTLAGRKLAIVEARLADLSRLRKTLRALIARCDTSRGKVSCPIICVLSSSGRV